MIKNGADLGSGALPGLTIGELSAATGLSVRNIRAYQSRRLLPPPTIRGRVGYYGPEHVARIELIHRFQAEGFNLRAVQALVERGETFLDEVETLRRELQDEATDGWIPMTEEEQRLCEETSPGSLVRFQQIGTIRKAPDGTLTTHPTFSEAGWALNQMGVSPEAIIDMLFVTARMISKIGDVYVDVLRQRSGAALDERGSKSEVQAMRDVFDEMTPHAVQIMTTLFEVVLRKESAASLERTIRQLTPTGEPVPRQPLS